MRTGWKWSWMGLAAGLLAGSPMAFAHELVCEKTVNGEVHLEVDRYPTTLRYELTVINTHPTSASILLDADDPLLEGLGWSGFDTPETIPLGGRETERFSVRVESYEDCLRLAARDGKADAFIDNTLTVRWDSGSDVCSARVICKRPPNGQPEDGRRMTGGGSVFGAGPNRVTHGFQLRCDPNDPRQNLEVNRNLPGPGADNFHLLDLTSARCIDDPALDEGNPVAGFDTFIGTGTGTWNNQPGATIQFRFTDDGEPGRNDVAEMTIRDASGAIVLQVSGTLNFGNHQAHP